MMKRFINLNKKSIGIASSFTKSLHQFNVSTRNFNTKRLEGCDLNSSLKYVKDEIKKSNKCKRLFSTVQSKEKKDSEAESSRVAIITEIKDTPGSLLEVLKFFWKYNVQLTHIESRPNQQNSSGFNMYIDFEGKLGDANTDKLMEDLRTVCSNMLILDNRKVPWFPRHISELDTIANKTMDAGADLQSDHPGFNDPVYRKRREELADLAIQYKWSDPIPYIQYTEEEIKTWGAVYNKLSSLQDAYACNEYNAILPEMQKYCGYSATQIPQAQDISNYLNKKTGFRLRPVAGLLSSRDFLNGLAFKTFFSTQYIRHGANPLYTPEPDICHELLGHAPMFADPDFAEFSQEIGLASLGASDEDIKRLATCYWFSVEFGVLNDNGKVKAYGAGLLSSFGELEYSCKHPYNENEIEPTEFFDVMADGAKPFIKKWDPAEASTQEYPICTYQPIYFMTESLKDAKDQMRSFCEKLPKPFHARYNPLTQSVWVSRAVSRDESKNESSPY